MPVVFKSHSYIIPIFQSFGLSKFSQSWPNWSKCIVWLLSQCPPWQAVHWAFGAVENCPREGGGGRGKVVRGGLREEDFILRSLLMATAPIITSLIALDWETTKGWSVERIVVPMSSLPASCGGHQYPNPSSTTSQTTVSTVLLAAKMGTQEKN